MGKLLFFILTFIVSYGIANAQEDKNTRVIDTVKVNGDTALVRFHFYKNDTLYRKGKAYIFNYVHTYKPWYYKPFLFLKKSWTYIAVIPVGKVKTIHDDGSYRIEEYENGQRVDKVEYDASGTVISDSGTIYFHCYILDHEIWLHEWFE